MHQKLFLRLSSKHFLTCMLCGFHGFRNDVQFSGLEELFFLQLTHLCKYGETFNSREDVLVRNVVHSVHVLE